MKKFSVLALSALLLMGCSTAPAQKTDAELEAEGWVKNPLENGYGIYEDTENPSEGIVSGEWMNCVGNLMLMAGRQNSSLGNRPFPHKIQIYGKDNLLNQQKEIIEFVTDKDNPVWDKASIEKRFNKIINAAKDIWSLDNI